MEGVKMSRNYMPCTMYIIYMDSPTDSRSQRFYLKYFRYIFNTSNNSATRYKHFRLSIEIEDLISV